MKVVWVLLFSLALTAVVGCVALTPEQQGALDKLGADIKETAVEAEKTAKLLERLYILQDEVRKQYAAGKLTPQEAMIKLEQFGKEIKEGVERYTNLKKRGAILLTDYKNLKEQGVPWYYSAGAVVSAIFNILLVKYGLNMRGALVDTLDGVEKANDKVTKLAIADRSNGVVKSMVRKMFPNHTSRPVA